MRNGRLLVNANEVGGLFGSQASAVREVLRHGKYKACRQCFYEFGDPNVYGADKCSVEACANRCAVTSDGLIVTCMSCSATLCSWCDECDQCAEARKQDEAAFIEGIYGAQDY